MNTYRNVASFLPAWLLAASCWIGCHATAPSAQPGTPAERASTRPASRPDRKFTNRWYFWPAPASKDSTDYENHPGILALQPDYLQLDDAMHWQVVNVRMYPLHCPNFSKKTGWRLTSGGKIERVQVTPEGYKVLRSISFSKEAKGTLPLVESANGDGWGLKWNVIVHFGRKQAKWVEPYSSGTRLMQSPRGTIWIYNSPIGDRPAGFYRFDASSATHGKREHDTALEEFSFRAGHLKFSCPIPAKTFNGDVYVRTTAGWSFMESPFGVSAPLSACKHALWRDRLLFSTFLGNAVLEYDLTRRRWIVLAEGEAVLCIGVHAAFDEQGRRIIYNCWNRTVYVYDGDPFEAWDRLDEAVRPRIKRLLVRLNSASWREREQATQDLAELAKEAPDAVKMLRGEESLPREVNMRVNLVVSGAPASLLRRMTPTTYPSKSIPP